MGKLFEDFKDWFDSISDQEFEAILSDVSSESLGISEGHRDAFGEDCIIAPTEGEGEIRIEFLPLREEQPNMSQFSSEYASDYKIGCTGKKSLKNCTLPKAA